MGTKYFWYSNKMLEKLEDTEGIELGFEHFDETHIILLIIATAIIGACTYLFSKLGVHGRTVMLNVISVLMVADELVKHIGNLALDSWTVHYLPLHLCSVNIFICVAYTITKNKSLSKLLYCFGAPGAFLALLLPSWTNQPVLNFMHLHSYTIHILLLLFPILLVVDGYRPTIKDVPKCFMCIVIYAIPLYFINKLLDTDFLFINGAKKTPFEDIVKVIGDPWYVPLMLILFGILALLMCLPWDVIRKQIEKRKSTTNQA
ncbi:MAG: TIGR02206 family membrane protein [Oscillospiraceae bacterium]|nr:TIGR02206 family membrane protein [Oscillospiraceae bacterium]